MNGDMNKRWYGFHVMFHTVCMKCIGYNSHTIILVTGKVSKYQSVLFACVHLCNFDIISLLSG